jgi:hypothetical protein
MRKNITLQDWNDMPLHRWATNEEGGSWSSTLQIKRDREGNLWKWLRYTDNPCTYVIETI